MDLTVAIATYGTPDWADLAQQRAAPSAHALGLPIVHVHSRTLAAARNAALEQVPTEWVVHLDADDELEAGFAAPMAAAAGDVRVPAVRYIHPDGHAEPVRMPQVAGHTHLCAGACLPEGNWAVVGSVVRTDLVRQVGGWLNEPIYEDWSLWLRCHLAGATFEPVPQAVYRAHRRPSSRNVALTIAQRRRAYHHIRRTAGVAT